MQSSWIFLVWLSRYSVSFFLEIGLFINLPIFLFFVIISAYTHYHRNGLSFIHWNSDTDDKLELLKKLILKLKVW